MEFIVVIGVIIGLIAGMVTIIKDVPWKKIKIPNKNRNTSARKDAILLKKKVKVAVAHYPPLSLLSKNLDGKGYSISGPIPELLNMFRKKYDLQLEVIPVMWDRLDSHYTNDECDFLLPIFPSLERNKFGKVVGVSHKIALGAVTLQDNKKVTDVNDITRSDVKIGVIEGEVGWEFMMRQYPKKMASTETIVVKSHDITDVMIPVLQKGIDIAIADSLSCFRFIRENDPTEELLHDPFLLTPIAVFDTGVLVRNDDEIFADWIEEEFLNFRNTPAFLGAESKNLQGWTRSILREGIFEDTVAPKIPNETSSL